LRANLLINPVVSQWLQLFASKYRRYSHLLYVIHRLSN